MLPIESLFVLSHWFLLLRLLMHISWVLVSDCAFFSFRQPCLLHSVFPVTFQSFLPQSDNCLPNKQILFLEKPSLLWFALLLYLPDQCSFTVWYNCVCDSVICCVLLHVVAERDLNCDGRVTSELTQLVQNTNQAVGRLQSCTPLSRAGEGVSSMFTRFRSHSS